MKKIENKLSEIGGDLIAALILELRAQDHVATGRLINSLESRVEKSMEDSFELQILFNKYGMFQNTGARWSDKMPPVKVIARWVEQRGIVTGSKEIMRAAWAIAMALKREGMPTKR